MASKIKKIRGCDWLLLALTIIILSSSIQLEIISGKLYGWVVFHIITGLCFLTAIGWHIYLHYGWTSWVSRLRKKFAWLSSLYFLTAVSALIALTHWLTDPSHSAVGAVHGKIGFLFLIIVICHVAKRIKFFRPKTTRKH